MENQSIAYTFCLPLNQTNEVTHIPQVHEKEGFSLTAPEET